MSCGNCRKTCACVVTAGDGITVTGGGTGTNPYVISGEGGAAAIETGCGLVGDGTLATPLAAAPAAGEEAWPWTCDIADGSTLKCDPATGQLWTPPEHASAVITALEESDFVQQSAPGTYPLPFGAVEFTISGTECRQTVYQINLSVRFDTLWDDNAIYRLDLRWFLNGGLWALERMGGNWTNTLGNSHVPMDAGSWNWSASFNTGGQVLPGDSVTHRFEPELFLDDLNTADVAVIAVTRASVLITTTGTVI